MRRRREVRRTPTRRLSVAGPGPGNHTVCVVHPGALPSEVYRNLAAALEPGAGLTVCDLGLLPDYGEAAPVGPRDVVGVPELARQVVAELEPERRRPSWTLLGWSFGGLVAYEIASQLPRERQPDRVVLLDSIAPTIRSRHPDDSLDQAQLFAWFSMYLGARRGCELRLPAGATIVDLAAELARVSAADPTVRTETPMGLTGLYRGYVNGVLRNVRFVDAYRPARATFPLVVVTAERSLRPGDATLGWHHLALAGIEVRTCPGDHYTMITRPDAALMIARLSQPDLQSVRMSVSP